ncbi:MAG: hypothetical protein VX675_04845 [Planctomycetota bacterium]|nr:hypothetical protein [Planctomycetota bacterium]
MKSPRLPEPLDTGGLSTGDLDQLVIADNSLLRLVSPTGLLFSPGGKNTEDRQLAAVETGGPLDA